MFYNIDKKILSILIASILQTIIVQYAYSSDGEIFYDENSIFAKYLNGDRLKFNTLNNGEIIEFNNVIVMPKANESAHLKLGIDLQDVDKTFINDVFYENREDLKKSHYLLQPGIELVLTNKKLLINLYPGIVLNFREDIYKLSNYITFNKNTKAEVIEVSGKVLLSQDTEIIKRDLSGVFVLFRYGKKIDKNGIMTIIKPKKHSPKK